MPNDIKGIEANIIAQLVNNAKPLLKTESLILNINAPQSLYKIDFKIHFNCRTLIIYPTIPILSILCINLRCNNIYITNIGNINSKHAPLITPVVTAISASIPKVVKYI